MSDTKENLRSQLVETALQWEHTFGNVPAITTAISEYDAATRFVGCSIEEYSQTMQGSTAVQIGYDFKFRNKRYQVKGTRFSGKPKSKVSRIPKPKRYKKSGKFEWDILIWIHYDPQYQIQEAWQWDVSTFITDLELCKNLTPKLLRQGKRLA
jgi:hypothetical protein